MAEDNRFKQAVITTLAKRAANQCSNPDCGAITSGPADDQNRAVNVGEAAHIYGANIGSARYDPDMSAADRSAITNAIWLCGVCHKLVDDDPARYPAGLLFEWQKAHEHSIAERVGRTGAHLRQRYEARHLEDFGRLSYAAERLITEKGDAWEYRLTAEVLRFEMASVLRRWNALRQGLYMNPVARISTRSFPNWLSDRMNEAGRITIAFEQLMNVEFKRAWGEPGIAGDDHEIVSVCRLFAEMCGSALRWEECVRFSVAPNAFEDVADLLQGVVGHMIDEAAKVPRFLTDVLSDETASGTQTLSLTLTLPEGWSERVSNALEQATHAVVTELQGGHTSFD